MILDPEKVTELAPFIPGEEVRTFRPLEFDLLVRNLPKPPIRPRTLTAARLVLVEKIPYRSVAQITGESQQFVRGATLTVMERLGYTGRSFYAHDPDQSLVLRGIAPEYHARLRTLVAAQVSEWEREKVGAAFDGWQGDT